MRLAYDVGAYDGNDTAQYLSRGFQVVAIEADPTLAQQLRERFAAEITEGRCTVLNIGVGSTDSQIPFYICDAVPIWSSFDPSHAAKKGHTTRPISIPCKSFRSVIEEYGVPYFLKLDIEGIDHLCVLSLTPSTSPAFLSFESGEESARAVMHLESMGYTKFRIVNQRNNWSSTWSPAPGSLKHLAWSARQVLRLNLRRAPILHRMLRSIAMGRHTNGAKPGAFPANSSGPIPDQLPDSEWMGFSEFLFTWESIKRAGILESAWFDIHAAHGSTSPVTVP